MASEKGEEAKLRIGGLVGALDGFLLMLFRMIGRAFLTFTVGSLIAENA